MSRTTAAAVRKIAKVKLSLSDADIAPFIETSSFLVDQCCLESDYDDVTLELIERWLAAHFYSVYDPRRSEERADVLSAVYEGKTNMGLTFTRYGQMAMLIDVKGNLAALNATVNSVQAKRITAKFVWLGTVCQKRRIECGLL